MPRESTFFQTLSCCANSGDRATYDQERLAFDSTHEFASRYHSIQNDRFRWEMDIGKGTESIFSKRQQRVILYIAMTVFAASFLTCIIFVLIELLKRHHSASSPATNSTMPALPFPRR